MKAAEPVTAEGAAYGGDDSDPQSPVGASGAGVQLIGELGGHTEEKNSPVVHDAAGIGETDGAGAAFE